MKHAEGFIARILFLEGHPIVNCLNKINIGAQVEEQLANDWTAEDNAIKVHYESIRLATEVGDNGSRDPFESFLTAEEDHIDWIETQLDQTKQMGSGVSIGSLRQRIGRSETCINYNWASS